MKLFYYLKILFCSFPLLVMAVSCADIDSETRGYAFLGVQLDDVSKRESNRSQFTKA